MIIVCPKCSKRFVLEDTLLPPKGRQVRCTACYHVWKQAPENPPFTHTPPLRDFTSPPNTSTASHIKKKRTHWIKSVTFLTLLFLLVNVFVFGRPLITTLWPASERIYAYIHLSKHTANTEFSIYNIIPKLYKTGDIDMLVISGTLKNISTQARPVTTLKIRILGEEEKGTAPLLDHWEHDLSTTYLLPEETLSFETAPRPKVAGAKTITLEL